MPSRRLTRPTSSTACCFNTTGRWPFIIARRTVPLCKRPAANPYPHLRWRSYNMSQSINGDSDANPLYSLDHPCLEKYTAVRHPSRIFVLLTKVRTRWKTRNLAALRSALWDDGSLVGHAIRPAYARRQPFLCGWSCRTLEMGCAKNISWLGWSVTPEEMPDFRRVQNAMKQPYDD